LKQTAEAFGNEQFKDAASKKFASTEEEKQAIISPTFDAESLISILESLNQFQGNFDITTFNYLLD